MTIFDRRTAAGRHRGCGHRRLDRPRFLRMVQGLGAGCALETGKRRGAFDSALEYFVQARTTSSSRLWKLSPRRPASRSGQP